MEFTIKFIGHLNERTKPEGFPAEVNVIGTYRVDNNKEIAGIIQNELMAFIHQIQGMIVQTDPAQTVDLSKLNVSDRFYIPMSQISYIRAEVNNMTAMPSLVETGDLDKDGKPIKEFQTPEGYKLLPS